MTNQTHIIRFDGNYFSYTDENGEVIRIPAISGKTNSQNSEYQNISDGGPIPEGFYDVKQSKYEDFFKFSSFQKLLSIVGRGEWPGGIDKWGAERIWLIPQSSTETFGRDNFTIHGGLDAGSRGCIDLVNNASIFFQFFQISWF